MQSKTEMIRDLRSFSKGKASIRDCLKALTETEGNLENAKVRLIEGGFVQQSKSLPGMNITLSDVCVPAGWVYAMVKVELFLKIGPDAYRKADAAHMPDAALAQDVLEDVSACFRQLMEGKGHWSDNPVENVSIPGLYAALSTLHFAVEKQWVLLTSGVDVLTCKRVKKGPTLDLCFRALHDEWPL